MFISCNSRYPKFALCRVPLLPSHEPDRTLRACMLLYTCYLFEMYCLRHKDIEKHGECLARESVCGWQEGRLFFWLSPMARWGLAGSFGGCFVSLHSTANVYCWFSPVVFVMEGVWLEVMDCGCKWYKLCFGAGLRVL